MKYRRSPDGNSLGYPHGYADLPGAVDAELVLRAGILGGPSFRSSNGTHRVEEGIRRLNSYAARRALTWCPGHPRDASAIAALRRLSGPWEVGWRESVAD